MKTIVVERAKLKIKESIAANDRLIAPQELAKRLNIDVKSVEGAYKELIQEGIVHRETYALWKNPSTRCRLHEAMKERTVPFSLEEIRETLGIE
ncbi:winged helix-turn-helix transcriptional regulator [Candidatus Poribacteria bacterium]|nr:winged helix-turn-helix transcriptional regulator [Candidatus Poribacteria bacterium]